MQGIQTESHSTKCDTHKKTEETEKKRERKKEGRKEMGQKEKKETRKQPWALDQVKGYCRRQGPSGLAMTR
jgi:hypothetical protein